MRLSNVERETIVTYNQAERTANIYTHNPALIAQLLELCQSHPEQVRQTAANDWGGLTFELPGAEGRVGSDESKETTAVLKQEL